MGQNNEPRHDSFSCGPDYGVDWNFSGKPGWRMTDKEGVRWEDIGPMNETGRQAVLKHFDLESEADQLPLEVIAGLSPDMLMRVRTGAPAIAA